jgi:factor associated with neutral sphingomyelinase activation
MFADSSQRSSKRFSLLLLEDGDDYVQDWVAAVVCKTPKPQTSNPSAWIPPETVLKGRLRLCSRSFFFEPDQVRTPILMFPFRKVVKIDQAVTPRGTSEQPASDSPNSRFKFGQEAPHSSERGGGILVQTQLLVKMKENGVDAPYVYEKGDSLWVFHLEYAPVQQFLGQAKRFLEINSMDYQERDKALASMAQEREGAAKFDTSRLADLSEHILLDLPAAQVIYLFNLVIYRWTSAPQTNISTRFQSALKTFCQRESVFGRAGRPESSDVRREYPSCI